ncbi:hypothetical protein FRC10_000792 [Ceratobasidium sp. 414]|nr:hypothetical protein FRC10_000792 [Ceratobasidium sp. 414]
MGLGARSAASLSEKLAHYASFPQTPGMIARTVRTCDRMVLMLSLVSLHQMVAFGRDPTAGKVLRGAKFLAGLPTIKIPPSAHRIFLPAASPSPFAPPATAPREFATSSSQRRFYVSPTSDTSWTPELLEVNSRFIKVLERARRRHDPTIYRVAYGVREYLRKAGGNGAQGADEELQNWLDRFYMSRISMRFLMSQHMAISSQQPPPEHHVGIINERTDIALILQDAIDNATFTCEEHYGLSRAPRIILTSSLPASTHLAYVPGHLSHIAFELLKNSLRATVERHTDSKDGFPDIHVDVMEILGTNQIAIRIRDEGGGIKAKDMPLVWRYSYSSVDGEEDVTDDDEDGMKGGTVKAPMAGYGYGLPLSRLVG